MTSRSGTAQQRRGAKPRAVGTAVAGDEALAAGSDLRAHTFRLLGGVSIVGRANPGDPYSAHEMIAHGLPNKVVERLSSQLNVMGRESFEQAVGISTRTLQRWAKRRSQRLSQEQGGRVWKFAELLAKASTILGSQAEAEQWFERPAIGLNQQRPIELLSTPAGVELVEDYLDRLAYGVYT